MAAIGNTRLDAGRPEDENYLKAILQAHMNRGRAYVTDLAEILNLSLSKSYAIANRLVDAGLILPLERRGGRKSNRQTLQLTPAGKEWAESILKKHLEIKTWLMCLGISENEAEEEACHWEHSISDKTMQVIQDHIAMAHCGRKRGRPAKSEMREMLRKGQQESGKSAVENIIELSDQYGGIEGLRQREQLIERAGGLERLAEILDLVDAMGGYETLSKESTMLLELKETVCRRAGSPDKLNRTLDLVDEMGGPRKLRAEKDMLLRLKEIAHQRRGEEKLMENLRLFDSLGGTQELTKFQELADSMGGVKNALGCLSRSYHMWSSLLQSTSDQEP